MEECVVKCMNECWCVKARRTAEKMMHTTRFTHQCGHSPLLLWRTTGGERRGTSRQCMAMPCTLSEHHILKHKDTGSKVKQLACDLFRAVCHRSTAGGSLAVTAFPT